MNRFSVKQSFLSIALILFLLTGSGCFYLVIGGVGALGGYAISPDTVEGMVGGYTTQDVWRAAVDTVSIMGLIEEKDEMAGVVLAKVQGARVTITVAELVADTVKLRVKVRRGMMPKIKLAQDIFTKIVQKTHP